MRLPAGSKRREATQRPVQTSKNHALPSAGRAGCTTRRPGTLDHLGRRRHDARVARDGPCACNVAGSAAGGAGRAGADWRSADARRAADEPGSEHVWTCREPPRRRPRLPRRGVRIRKCRYPAAAGYAGGVRPVAAAQSAYSDEMRCPSQQRSLNRVLRPWPWRMPARRSARYPPGAAWRVRRQSFAGAARLQSPR